MSIIKIEACKVSKSGKSLSVTSHDSTGAPRYYSAKLDSNIDNLVGQTIDVEVTTSEYNGQAISWLNKYRVVPSDNAPVQSLESKVDKVVAAIQSDHMRYMPFISNCLAHLITAGKVESTEDLEKWAMAAYSAAIKVEEVGDMRSKM